MKRMRRCGANRLSQPKSGNDAVTNDVLQLVPNLRLHPQGRRARDLLQFYIREIGEDRMKNESIKLRVENLVLLQLQVEALAPTIMAGKDMFGRLLREENGIRVYESTDPYRIQLLAGQALKALHSLGLDYPITEVSPDGHSKAKSKGKNKSDGEGTAGATGGEKSGVPVQL